MPFKIGSILKESKILKQEDIDKALWYQSKTGLLLGKCLIDLKICSEAELQYAIKKQLKYKESVSQKKISIKGLTPFFFFMIKEYTYIIALAFFSLLSAIFSPVIVNSLIMGYLFDIAIPSQDYQTIVITCTVFFLGSLLSQIFSYLRDMTATFLNVRVVSKLAYEALHHLNSCSPIVYINKTNKKNDVINRITENTEVVFNTSDFLYKSLFYNLFLLFFIFTITAYIDIVLTVIALTTMILCVVIPSHIGRMANPYIYKTPSLINDISSSISEILNSFLFIKINNKGRVFRKRLDSRLESYYRNDFNKWMSWNLSFNIKVASNLLVSLLILTFGGYQVINSSISVGELVIFYFIMTLFMPILDNLYFLYIKLFSLQSNFNRVAELLNFPKENDMTASYIPLEQTITTIDVKNVTIEFSEHKQPVFSNLSISFRKGETYAVVGKSGVGKSVFTRFLLGLIHPVSGELFFNGLDNEDIHPPSLWSQIGYLHSPPFIIKDRSIYDNIVFGCENPTRTADEIMSDVVRAAMLANIFDSINGLPDKFDTILGKDQELISGGELQRIAIARIIFKDPSVLILDEPTSALDKNNAMKIVQNLLELSKDKILIVITHNREIAKRFDNRIYFTKGCVQKERSGERVSLPISGEKEDSDALRSQDTSLRYFVPKINYSSNE